VRGEFRYGGNYAVTSVTLKLGRRLLHCDCVINHLNFILSIINGIAIDSRCY
jgi:hypothetical protein